MTDQRTIIPYGKHKGRALSELTKAEFDALRNGWNGSEVLKTNPFFRQIEQHRIEREKAPK